MKFNNQRTRYTTDQVLRGIQAFVSEHCGPKFVVDLDASLLDYQRAAQDSHDCPLWFLEDLANYFGLKWDDRRWVIWLRLRSNAKTKTERKANWQNWLQEIAPKIRVRDLATLIASRAEAPSFEPVYVFGSRCATAGIFTGLTELPELAGKRVAPSTSLLVFWQGSRIAQVWRRVEWITGVELPSINVPSPNRWPTVLGRLLLVLWTAALFALLGVIGDNKFLRDSMPFWFMSIMLFTVLSAPVALIGTLIDQLRNPLPANVRTFGDLSRIIATKRGARGA